MTTPGAGRTKHATAEDKLRYYQRGAMFPCVTALLSWREEVNTEVEKVKVTSLKPLLPSVRPSLHFELVALNKMVVTYLDR